jgi:4-hydroxy-tetrahydrodipicolinate synthase
LDIRGSICALVTPFAADGGLDLEAFGRLLDFQIEGGTQAVVVAGSTGEAHMLEHAEYERLLAFALERVAGRVPVVAGTGEAGTAKTVALTRRARELGADAALVVTPYYVRPTQEGLRRHFLEVAEQGGLPVILYNVPGRTGCDLLPATVARLGEHPAIVGIKEARGDAERIAALAELARADFVYLSGDDGSAARAMLAGAAGTISVVANLAPRPFRALCDAATGGDRAAAERHEAALAPLVEALNCAPNPIAVKAGLPELGLGTALPRLPLVELEDGPERARLREALAGLASLAHAA